MPHIDSLADEGIRFDRAFTTNSLCGPARAVVLTSKYSHINGFEANNELDPQAFNESQVTESFCPWKKLNCKRWGCWTTCTTLWIFPKLLKKAGYYTSMIGKYHLNSFPNSEGFDYWQILDGQGDYYSPVFFEQSPDNRVQYTAGSKNLDSPG